MIAEDEPLLAAALARELAAAWPALRIVATVGDGAAAVAQALALRPDVLFFDIRMPGLGGMEAAAQLADAWPLDAATPFPALVFVTAYDQYAVQAFEAQAIDYVQKPVQPARLARTVTRVQATLAAHGPAATALDAAVAQLRALLAPAAAPQSAPLAVLPVALPGGTVRMLAAPEVLYFEAADKYLRVLTATDEFLIRTSLRELLPQLDAAQFWQVHRGTVVQAAAIDRVLRDDATGRLRLLLHGRAELLDVSRLYAQRFRAL